mmetsp:Transcript_9910/g.13729  ORF Transcript_9910/g.13729 Transcript_9910/m.13729 type:complete len:316 (+) Transcript_9910:42-989(+)
MLPPLPQRRRGSTAAGYLLVIVFVASLSIHVARSGSELLGHQLPTIIRGRSYLNHPRRSIGQGEGFNGNWRISTVIQENSRADILSKRASVFPWFSQASVTIKPAERNQLQPLSSKSVLDDLASLCTDAIFQPSSQRLANDIEKYLYKKIIERYGPSNSNENCLFLAQSESAAVANGLSPSTSPSSVVGCVGLEVVPVTLDGKPEGEDVQPRPLLEFLAVDPSARGRGIGKSLLKQCEAKAREWGYDEIILQVAADNDVAINLYKKAGYSIIAEDNTILRPKEGGLFGGMGFEPALHLCLRKELSSGPFLFPKFF